MMCNNRCDIYQKLILKSYPELVYRVFNNSSHKVYRFNLLHKIKG